MAELAAGAVSSLLGVIRNDAQLLQRVGHDVQFIKEEMESMNSFLEHLARTAPPDGSHDEQVQTWIKQVRYLAHDCSNCIDRYLQRGDPAIHRARGGLRGYFWWAYWFVLELIAQHKAAARLRELRERASDVGKRRLRYGVEIPGKLPPGALTSATLMPSSSSSSQAVASLPTTQDDDEDGAGLHQMAMADESSSYYQQQLLEPPTLDNYFLEKIATWVAKTRQKRESIRSIAIVVSDNTAGDIVSEGLTKACAQFKHTVWINLPLIHYPLHNLGPNEVLCYILLVCTIHKDNKDLNYVDKIDQFIAWKHRKGVEREIRNEFEEHAKSKIQDLVTRIEDMESKVNIKRVGGAKTRQTDGEGSKTEGTDGGNKTIEENGGSNTTRVKKIEETGWDSKTVEQTSGTTKTQDKTFGGNTTDEIVDTEGSVVLQIDKPLGVLYLALLSEEERNKAKNVLAVDEQTIINVMAEKLKKHMERDVNSPKIKLFDTQYKVILREVFLTSNPQEATIAASATSSSTNRHAATTTLGDDQIKEIMEQIKGIIHLVKQDIVEEIQATKSDGTGEKKLGQDQVASAIQDTKNRITQISLKIKEQMIIKGIVDKINSYLKDEDTLFIIVEDKKRKYELKWEDIMNGLKLLECAKGSAVIVTTKNTQKANEFCYPLSEPITCSIVGLYHDIVLKLTQQWVNNEDDNNSSQILRDILDKCHPHEFCMKMFACALYANPNRSNKELRRLRDTLQISENSLDSKAKKIFKFSYRDLHREHKTCLLYLAIFPQGANIRRSTLIGRWLTEGLITKEDWPTAVRHAERCLNALINRGLVSPGDISAKGEFKSCMVGDLIHGFITKIAKRQHILDARLSHMWAHHFSIFSGLRLCASDNIDMFVKKLHNYSFQLSLLKLLDLQDSQCFDKKSNYLKAICNNISLLKYLSLRSTNITHLPSEINNLHDLEILDIRQTKVPEKETKHVLLLKLKRLLAGDADPSLSCNGKDRKFSCVRIPSKIGKMENIEVLSNVMASRNGKELKDIRKLWQLRKLGVVIKDNDEHFQNLFQAIGDLNECLQSVSITIPETKSGVTSTNSRILPGGLYNRSTHPPKLQESVRSEVTSMERKILPNDLYNRLTNPPKLLESVSINGFTTLRIISLLGKGSNELSKLVLSGTKLKQVNLDVLANLPKLRCVRLRNDAYNDSKLTFNKKGFEHLKCLLVHGDNMNDIIFEEGAAAELEKIILSSTNVRSLSGFSRLPMLKELELKGNELLFVPFSKDGGAHKKSIKPVLLPKDGNVLVSPSKEGPAPQTNTDGLFPPSEEGPAPQVKTEKKITFKKGEFQHLKYLLFDDSKIVNITVEDGAAPELERIILWLTSKGSQLTVFGSLAKLKEIEVKGDKTILLSLLENSNKIDKVTLCETSLKKDEVGFLAKKGNICCLVLLDNSYDESELTFSKDEFPKLNLLIVRCSKIEKITFDKGSAPNLEKIVWSSFTELQSLSGIDNVEKLKELDLEGDDVPRQMKKDIRAHKNKPVLTLTPKKPQREDQAPKEGQGNESWIRRAPVSYFSKKKDQQ